VIPDSRRAACQAFQPEREPIDGRSDATMKGRANMNMMTSTSTLTAGAKKVDHAAPKSMRQLIADHKAAIIEIDEAIDQNSDLEEELPKARRRGNLMAGVVTEVRTDDPRWTAACHRLRDAFNISDEIAIAMLHAPISGLEDLDALMGYAGEHVERGLLWPDSVTMESDEEEPRDWTVLVLIKAAKAMRDLDRSKAPVAESPMEHRDYYGAYFELESEIRDITRAARLAQIQLWRAVGDLGHADGNCIEIPEADAIELAVFAVDQVAKATKSMEKTYDRLWDEARTGPASSS
jgi:hypothetical protein